MRNERKMMFTQTCDSRECRKNFKTQIKKDFCEAVTTPHKVNYSTGEIECFYCKKKSKI